MVWPIIAAAGITAIGGLLAADKASAATKKAASAQERSTAMGIEFQREQLAEQQRQYDEQMEEYRRKQGILETQQAQQRTLLAPYMQAGQGALFEMMALSGLAAPEQVTAPQQTAAPAVSMIKDVFTGAYAPEYGPRRAGTYSKSPTVEELEGTVMGRGPQGEIQIFNQPGQITGRGGISNVRQTMAQPDYQRGQFTQMDDSKKKLLERAELMKSGGYRALAPDYKKDLDQAYNYAKYLDKQAVQRQAEDQAKLDIENANMAALQIESPYAGMTGDQAQAMAINRISASPILQELMAQGEKGILQNQAATGGLRGGNVQGLLARYRPQMIQQEISNQYSRLGRLSGQGYGAITGQPVIQAQGYPTGTGVDTSIAQLYGRIGESQAANALAQGKLQAGIISDVTRAIGQGFGAYKGSGTDDTTQKTSQTPQYFRT